MKPEHRESRGRVIVSPTSPKLRQLQEVLDRHTPEALLVDEAQVSSVAGLVKGVDVKAIHYTDCEEAPIFPGAARQFQSRWSDRGNYIGIDRVSVFPLSRHVLEGYCNRKLDASHVSHPNPRLPSPE